MTEPDRRRASRKTSDMVLPKPKPEVEVGVPAYLPFSTPFRNAWEVLRDDDITVQQLVAMRRTDGQARALYRLITLPIRSALKTATFVPGDNVEGGEEEAQFAEQLFTLPPSAGGMTVPFDRVIAQMLMAIFDGFTAFEMVYWVPKDGPLKNKWTLKKLAHRPAETLSFLIDRNSEYAGLRQRTMFQGELIDKVLPPEHTVYYAAQEEEKLFYGKSYFEPAFFHWDKKYKLYVIAHLAAQRAAVGTRVGKIPPNPTREEKEAFKRALADFGFAGYMTIPDTYTVDSMKEFSGFDFLSLINHHNSQMSKSVLAAFFDKEQGGGDSGKLVDFGQQSDSLFMMMLGTIMGEIENIINNKVLPRFIDWNFDSQKYPKFQFGSLSKEQKGALIDTFKTLAVAGQSLTIRPEFIHELEKQVSEEFGLEIDWDTIEEEMAIQEEAMAEEAEAQAQMQAMDPMGAAGATGGTPPQVDPALLPPGFTLLSGHTDKATLALSDLALDLLDEAYQTVTLAQGVPAAGQKRVRTAAGAKIYGVPIGTPITRDMEERTSGQGVKGKPFGGGIRNPNGPGAAKTPIDRQTLGGGPGAAPQNPGSVNPHGGKGAAAAKRTFTHPDQPGVTLLDFGDGTVAIRDAAGNISSRQRYDIAAFLKLGWKVDGAYSLDDNDTGKGTKAKAKDDDKSKGQKKTT